MFEGSKGTGNQKIVKGQKEEKIHCRKTKHYHQDCQWLERACQEREGANTAWFFVFFCFAGSKKTC
jgi:ABC-type siderophore export system fused ATPase/permease subunit